MQQFVAKSHPFHSPPPIIFDQHIRILKNTKQSLAGCILCEVDGYAALVPIHNEERRRVISNQRRRHAMRIIAAWNLLHLADIRSHIGQQHRADRPCHHMRQINDLESA